jgi:hypothetical protein
LIAANAALRLERVNAGDDIFLSAIFLSFECFLWNDSKMKKERLYKTHTTLERTLRVAYPAGKGRMVLRTEQD